MYHSDIAHVLPLAFGRAVAAYEIPVSAYSHRNVSAYALDDHFLPARVILRRYVPQEQPHGMRAFTALRVMHQAGFIVPEVYFFGWSQFSGELLLLTEYIDGRGDEGQPDAFFARIGEDFARTLARLHQLPIDEIIDLAHSPFRYTFDSLAFDIIRLDLPELDAIQAWLGEYVGGIAEQPRTVLHGDYTLQNILAEHTRVCAVLNWERAAIGDPRFDVGYASAVLGIYGAEFSDRFVADYEVVAGPVVDRIFWEVFAAQRLLVQLANRVLTVPDEHFEESRAKAMPAMNALMRYVNHKTGLRL